MYRFIYVFDKKTADDLIAQGFHLIKSDEQMKVYVLENSPTIKPTFSKKDFVFSNTLTF